MAEPVEFILSLLSGMAYITSIDYLSRGITTLYHCSAAAFSIICFFHYCKKSQIVHHIASIPPLQNHKDEKMLYLLFTDSRIARLKLAIHRRRTARRGKAIASCNVGLKGIALALVVSFIFGAMITMSPEVKAAVNGSDNFDSYTPGLFPGNQGVGPFYTFTGNINSGYVSNQFSHSPSNSVHTTTNAGPNKFVFGSYTSDFPTCGVDAGNSVDFWLMISAFPANFREQRVILEQIGQSNTVGGRYGIALDATSITQAQALAFTQDNGAGSTHYGNAINGFTWVAGTFYHVQFTQFYCDAGSHFFILTVNGMASQAASPTVNSISTMVNSQLYGETQGGGDSEPIYVDDLNFFTTNSANIGALASSATFPSGYTLVGFSADYMHRSIIARLAHTGDNIQQIYSFDPITLSLRGATPVANSCTNRFDGVMATWQDPPGLNFDGYLDCTANAASVNTLSIRDGGLNSPPDQTGTLCESGNFCAFDLTSGTAPSGCPNNGELSGQSQQIGQIQSMPISWRAGNDIPGRDNEVSIGFAYSNSNNGNVGVFTDSQENNIGDRSCFDEKPFTGNNSPASDICTWHNSLDGNDYLTATSPTSNTITWQVKLTQIDESGIVNLDVFFVPTMIQVSQLGPGIAVGCGNYSNDILLVTIDGTLNRFRDINGNVGASSWPAAINNVKTGITRQAVMSLNQRWGAYVRNDNFFVVFNATNGRFLGQGPMPSGTFRGMSLSGNGQALYVATTSGISYFDVHNETTVISQPDNCVFVNNLCQLKNSDTTNQTNVPTSASIITASGTGCFQHYDGPIAIGNTYVPIADWTNCASMITETVATVAFLVLGVGFLQWKYRGEVSPMFLSMAGILGLVASLYIWQFPYQLLVIFAAVGVGIFFLARPKSSAGVG